jgi:hypothetical protein
MYCGHKGGTMRGRALASLVLCTALVALVAAIMAGRASAQTVYCVNGATTTLPITLTFAGGSRVFTEATAEAVIANSFDHSTFYLGFTIGGAGPFFFIPDATFDPDAILAPGYTRHSVSRGACTAFKPGVPGAAFMCGSGYGPLSGVDYVSGREAVGSYLTGATGRHYAFFVLGDLNGAQRAQPVGTAAPAGSFYCSLPAGLRVEAIMGADGKQMLADTQGTLYPSEYANMETIGHPAYRLIS